MSLLSTDRCIVVITHHHRVGVTRKVGHDVADDDRSHINPSRGSLKRLLSSSSGVVGQHGVVGENRASGRTASRRQMWTYADLIDEPRVAIARQGLAGWLGEGATVEGVVKTRSFITLGIASGTMLRE